MGSVLFYAKYVATGRGRPVFETHAKQSLGGECESLCGTSAISWTQELPQTMCQVLLMSVRGLSTIDIYAVLYEPGKKKNPPTRVALEQRT